MKPETRKMIIANRYTLISLIVILGMFGIFSAYYAPDGTVRTAIENKTGVQDIGGVFEMVDQDGQPFTHEDMAGKYSLIYFGYTFCPDVCPMGLTAMTSLHNALPQEMQDQLRLVFVSVDPDRDTPEVLKEYVDHFHDKMIALTGSQEQVDAMAMKYKVYHAKRPADEGGVYLMDHSSYIYLMAVDGKTMLKLFVSDGDQAEMIQTLKKMLYR